MFRLPSIRSLIKKLSIFLAVVGLFFFFRSLWNQSEELSSILVNTRSFLVVLASVVLVQFNFLLAIASIYFLIRAQNHSFSIVQLSSIFLISQIGKYLPGNVMQHVGLVYFLTKNNIPSVTATSVVVLQNLWTLIVSGFLSFLALFYFLPQDNTIQVFFSEYKMYLYFFPLLLLTPWLLIYLYQNWIPAIWKEKFFRNTNILYLSLSQGIYVTALNFLSFVLVGSLLYFQSVYLFGMQDQDYSRYIFLFSLSWIVGFLIPGAPAGVGIREFLILILFTPLVGESVAVGLGITMRFTTTLGDGLGFWIGLGLKKFFTKEIIKLRLDGKHENN